MTERRLRDDLIEITGLGTYLMTCMDCRRYRPVNDAGCCRRCDPYEIRPSVRYQDLWLLWQTYSILWLIGIRFKPGTAGATMATRLARWRSMGF